tara:strand:+ start:244 stop:459 length:216 start_codon:yes stop_codon:yes gene_type:complete
MVKAPTNITSNVMDEPDNNALSAVPTCGGESSMGDPPPGALYVNNAEMLSRFLITEADNARTTNSFSRRGH